MLIIFTTGSLSSESRFLLSAIILADVTRACNEKSSLHSQRELCSRHPALLLWIFGLSQRHSTTFRRMESPNLSFAVPFFLLDVYQVSNKLWTAYLCFLTKHSVARSLHNRIGTQTHVQQYVVASLKTLEKARQPMLPLFLISMFFHFEDSDPHVPIFDTIKNVFVRYMVL